MRKITVFFLIIFIVILFSYAAIRYFANADNHDNWFNNHYRAYFSKSPFLRYLFNLRWDGDGKADYLADSKFKKLKIEFDDYEGCGISMEELNEFAARVQEVIKKPEVPEIIFSDTLPLAKDKYTSNEIRKLAALHQNYHSRNGKESVFYILCLNRHSEKPTNIGLTLHEDGAVIFMDRLREVASGSPVAENNLVVSTLLHEFGHQLGLGHIKDIHCIMSESVEAPSGLAGSLSFVSAKYCPKELKEIEDIRKSLYNK